MTTRIWYENDAIQMDGVGSMPARSMTTALDGDRIHVLTLSGVRLSQLVYGEYANKAGQGFASATAAKAYLDAEFAKAPIVDWSSLTGKPATFAPSAHSHSIADVTGLSTALDGKQAAGSYAAAVHVHAIGDVTGLQSALDGKAALSHTHSIAQVTGLQAALDGKLGIGLTVTTPTRAIGTTFTPSATKSVLCIYSVKVQVTNPLLIGTSTAAVALLSDTNVTPATERCRAEASSGVGVTVTLALTTSNTSVLIYLVPAGHNVRLVSTVTGTGTTAIVSQTEVTLG